jgi:SAM-dependent methyltransferase
MEDKSSSRTKQESLDEIVVRNAIIVAEQIHNAAAWAKSEMDLQVEVAGALKGFARHAKIMLEGHHNVTVATGRPDSVYGSVIVEYKDPGTLSPNKNAAPNKAVIDQLKKRFFDMRREEHRDWKTMFGVGTDGKYFIFLRFRDDKWTDQEPLEVNRYSTERFLWALYNLGQKGKPYQPEYLHGDFGSDSPIAQEGVRELYDEIIKTENPKAQVFFQQWKILFGEVCGYDVENLSDKLKKLAEFYVVKGKPQPAPLLFAVHTYYAILIKLLAAEIVSFFNPWMPRQVEKLQSATSPAKLKRELEELERGGIFHQMGITNFLEGDLFSWYLAVWSDPIEKLVRKMIAKLDEYNPGTFSEEPAQSRDLLKKLYQQLFPKSVRHDLGEYYTPDWLAEHVLNELGYEGDPDKRLLDPACGSGTFLVMAINRIRRWYDANREKCAYDEGELLKKILANVIGFDLNPLAVMAARTNYLVAIKDLIRHVEGVEIPVYLCDSIMTPSEYGDLFSGATLGTVAKVPCSAMKPPHLLVPKEIAQSPKEVAKYAEVLETCIKNAYKPDEFLSRCRDEGLNITATDAHLDLYRELVKLDKANKNGIWARIIKNNFAPLFVGRVDYVAGNPPWVNYENLPAEYRESTAKVWETYKLFPKGGWRARFAKGNTELAMVFTYACADCYLSKGGKLGFVITQSVFQSKDAGRGFRAFRISEDRRMRIFSVDDFTAVKPFEGAVNRTATFTFDLCPDGTRYPVRYTSWDPKPGFSADVGESLPVVISHTTRAKLRAWPLTDPQSPWMVLPSQVERSTVEKVTAGKQVYRAWKGADTRGGNGILWLDVLASKGGSVVARNTPEFSRKKPPEVTWSFEPNLIFPLLKGKETQRWHTSPQYALIYPHEGDEAIPEAQLKASFPKTHAYFKEMEAHLLKRKMYDLSRRKLAFYSLFETGEFLFSKYKVVWKYIATELTCAVQEPVKLKYLENDTVIPDHKLVIVPCETAIEAHYLCAALNSSIARFVAGTYIVGTQISTHVVEYIKVPAFESGNKTHIQLADLSEKCHATAKKGDADAISEFERKIDKVSARLWGITDSELKAIQEALGQTGKSKWAAKEDEEE